MSLSLSLSLLSQSIPWSLLLLSHTRTTAAQCLSEHVPAALAIAQLTMNRPAIHPKSTTHATCGACRFRALRSGMVQESGRQSHVHTIATHTLMAFRFNRMFELSALQDQRLQFPEWSTCQTDTSAMRWWRVSLASLASSVVHCMIIDFDISAFGFRAAHGGHAILFVLACAS